MDSGELGTGFPWLCTDDLAIGTIGEIQYLTVYNNFIHLIT